MPDDPLVFACHMVLRSEEVRNEFTEASRDGEEMKVLSRCVVFG